MSGIDTSDFKERLETEQARLLRAVEYLHVESPGQLEDELGEIGGRGQDNHLGDMATVTFDRELDQGLEESAQDTLQQITAALARIAAGTYGTCEVCGKPIGEARLNALPWASLCIDDQRRLG